STNGTIPNTSRRWPRSPVYCPPAASGRRQAIAATSRSIIWKRPRCKRPRRGRVLRTANGPGACGRISATICGSSAAAIRAEAAPSGQDREDRLLVFTGAHLAFREDAVRGDPFACALVCSLVVGLEHQPLAGAPAPRIHHVAEPQREFLAVV